MNHYLLVGLDAEVVAPPQALLFTEISRGSEYRCSQYIFPILQLVASPLCPAPWPHYHGDVGDSSGGMWPLECVVQNLHIVPKLCTYK